MNVYEKTIERIKYIFKEFDNISVSFSGGKDSGVLLNLVYDYAKKNNKTFSIMHLDYEAQYKATTDYVDLELEKMKDIATIYRICVPFKAKTSCSMFDKFWRPWDPDKKELWVRNLPECYYKKEEFDFYNINMWDYDFQEKFSKWLHQKNKATKTCILVGIRTQESLNRWRAIHSDKNYKNYNNIKWSKKMFENVYNMYPIFDWTTEDIWIANTQLNYDYNKLYDLYYMSGLSINEMRVASPFISENTNTLKLFKVIEPETWGKLISRVNGVNCTAIYGGTTAMGWKNINKPNHFTWEEYMYFLLDTLPLNIKNNYLKKLETSMKFWKEKGGALSDEIIKKLQDKNINLELTHTNFSNKKAVKLNYLDDIDISEFKEIPTFKRMCICILKNDHLCKYMGFGLTKIELQNKKRIVEKYKNLL